MLGKLAEWEYLVGEPPVKWSPEAGTLKESSVNVSVQCAPFLLLSVRYRSLQPALSRKDTRDTFQWRVRNLPYPVETYALSIDQDQRQIVIRTSNKK